MRVIVKAFVLVFLFGFAFAISSEEATAKAKPYLDSGVGLLPKPLFVLSEYYYAFSPSIYSPKKIFVAVSEQDGFVEKDSSRLNAIGKSVYDYGVVEEYVKRNGVSFSEMEASVRQTLLAVDRNVNSLGALETKTQQTYPNVNFDSVEAKALELQRIILELDGIVSDGVNLEQQVENDLSDFGLSGLLDYYENAFAKTQEFIVVYDDYNEAISRKQAEIFKSSIPAPDNENIVKSLENMRLKVDLFEQMRFLKPYDGITKLDAARDKWVNDSVASFAYKSSTVDVKSKFDQLKPEIETVFLSEQNLALCGLAEEADSIKSKWRDVELLKERGSARDFERLPSLLDSLKAEYDSLKRQYDACIRPKQEIFPEEAQGQTNLLPWLVFGVIVIGGYLLWKYKQSQEETYS